MADDILIRASFRADDIEKLLSNTEKRVFFARDYVEQYKADTVYLCGDKFDKALQSFFVIFPIDAPVDYLTSSTPHDDFGEGFPKSDIERVIKRFTKFEKLVIQFGPEFMDISGEGILQTHNWKHRKVALRKVAL